MTNAPSDKSVSDDLDAQSVSSTALLPELLCEVVEDTRGFPDGSRAIGRAPNLDGAVVQKLEHNARWRSTNQRRGSRQETRVGRVVAIEALVRDPGVRVRALLLREPHVNRRSMDDLPAILPSRQREFRCRLRALLGLGPVLAVVDGALRPVADIRQGDGR